MTNALPHITYIRWGIEAGVPDNTTDVEPVTACNEFFWDTQSFSDSNSNNLQKLHALGGGRDVNCTVNGRYDGSLSIDAFVTTDAATLELVLGSLALGVATPSNTIPYFAVEIGYKDFSGNLKRMKFHYCKVNSCKFSQTKSGDPIKATLDIFVQRPWISNTFGVVATPTDCPFVGYEGIVAIGGVDIVGLQSFDLTITNTLEKIQSGNSRFDDGLSEGNRDYTYSMTNYFNSDSGITNIVDFFGAATYPTRSATPTSNSMTWVLTRGANTITFTFPASSVFVNTASQPSDIGSNLLSQTIDGHAETLTSITVV